MFLAWSNLLEIHTELRLTIVQFSSSLSQKSENTHLLLVMKKKTCTEFNLCENMQDKVLV